MRNEDTDGSDDERATGDDDATPKKGTRRRGKKTTNGTKETGAAAPVGAPIASFGAWTWGFTASLSRQTNHTRPTRTRVCLHGCCLDVPAGHPRWGYSSEAWRRPPCPPWSIRGGLRSLFKDRRRHSP